MAIQSCHMTHRRHFGKVVIIIFFNAGFTHSVVVLLMSLQHFVKHIIKIISFGLSFITNKAWRELMSPHKDGRVLIGTSHLTELPRKSGITVSQSQWEGTKRNNNF